MNTTFVATLDNVVSPKSSVELIKEKTAKQKNIVILNDEGYDFVDQLANTIDLIDEACHSHMKNIYIFGDLSETHRIMFSSMYPHFTFVIINL